jgi:ATP-dependent helicase Lhr and Lhr-like helicase
MRVLVAPTAGGKTEAAVFPVLSRVLSGGWPPLSVLYSVRSARC